MNTALVKFKLFMHLRSPNVYIVYMQCPKNIGTMRTPEICITFPCCIQMRRNYNQIYGKGNKKNYNNILAGLSIDTRA